MRVLSWFSVVFILTWCATGAAGAAPRYIGTFPLAQKRLEINRASLAAAAERGGKRIEVSALVDDSLMPGDLAAYGWRIVSRGGGVATLEGRAAAAPYLRALPGIKYVKMPSRVFPLLDSARKLTRVDEVHAAGKNGTLPRLTGTGVLLGMIDTEFDTRQPAFLDSNGITRFVAVWDQTDTARLLPNRFRYGTIKNRQQLLADSLFGIGPHFHGTTMTSYAAGGQWNTPYYGVAPGVSIAAVKMDDNDAHIVDGLRWLFSLADSLGLPCVVNMSLGNHDGPHDGTSLVDRTIDSLSGPGCVVVGAAGNDGDKKAHVTFSLARNATLGTWITGDSYTENGGRQRTWSAAELWAAAGAGFTADLLVLDTLKMTYQQALSRLSTQTSGIYAPDTVYFDNSATQRKDTVVFMAVTERASPLNGRPHLQVVMISSNPALYMGLHITATGTGGARVEAWNLQKLSFRNFGMTGFLEGDSIMSANELGGTAKRNITVGAYSSKSRYLLWNGRIQDWGTDSANPHPLNGYSSHGPTADGRIKPDITAPGSDVAGAMPRNQTDTAAVVLWPDTSTFYGRYGMGGGTSVASPIVAGIVALLLEARPALTPDSAKRLLQETAITDVATGPIATPNNLWGAGKVNAWGAVARLLGTGVDRPVAGDKSRAPVCRLQPVPGSRLLLTNYRSVAPQAVVLEYVSLDGRTVLRQAIDKRGFSRSFSFMPQGMYLVRALAEGRVLCSGRVTIISR